MELRTLADTVQSTRLFNESEAGFRAVLDDIAARGIRHVIVVGDYSDDGQDESVAASLALMQSYADRFGMRFFSTVGNHDVYGYSGRSLDRSFLLEDGGSFLISGSRPDGEGVLFNPAMRCRSYAESLPRGLGFFRDGTALHWETPFGASDDLADRQYTLSSPDGRHERRFIDASYLVEPVEGVWLLPSTAMSSCRVTAISTLRKRLSTTARMPATTRWWRTGLSAGLDRRCLPAGRAAGQAADRLCPLSRRRPVRRDPGR